jgi:hypothetical protein
MVSAMSPFWTMPGRARSYAVDVAAWGRNRDGSVVYVLRDGAGGWVEVPREYWPEPPASLAPASSRQPRTPEPGRLAEEPPGTLSKAPEPVRQFLRESGRRGGLERARSFASHIPRCALRFNQLYECNPHEVRAAPISASPEVRQRLREFASRAGRERARRYPKDTLRAWAVKGGHAKAAKRRSAFLARHPAQDIAGKQR